MGLFKKKPDPISERAKALNDQIAALEAEIKRLSEAPAETAAPAETKASPFAARGAPTPAPATPAAPQPRIRSTTVPYALGSQNANIGGEQAPATVPRNPEPVFESVDQNRIKEQAESVTPASHYNELGVRKYDLPALLRRILTNVRGPATNNP